MKGRERATHVGNVARHDIATRSERSLHAFSPPPWVHDSSASLYIDYSAFFVLLAKFLAQKLAEIDAPALPKRVKRGDVLRRGS